MELGFWYGTFGPSMDSVDFRGERGVSTSLVAPPVEMEAKEARMGWPSCLKGQKRFSFSGYGIR